MKKDGKVVRQGAKRAVFIGRETLLNPGKRVLFALQTVVEASVL